MHRKTFYRNWQQSWQSLAQPQYYVFNCVCNNDCKRKSDTAFLKHLLEIEQADFQDTGNQMNTLHEMRIKNANQSIIGHSDINSLRNMFEMVAEIIKEKIDIFLISKTKLDSGQFIIKGYSTPFR